MTPNSPIVTTALIATAIVLGFPVAVVTAIFNSDWVPNVVLGSKTVDIGLGQIKTIDFGLLTGSNDAVFAAALISMVCTTLLIIGFVLIRHFTTHNAFSWLAFGPAFLNLLSQVGCYAAVFILNTKCPAATSNAQIRCGEGIYNTGGNLYTKEAWSCSMDALYKDREGTSVNQACSRFRVNLHTP